MNPANPKYETGLLQIVATRKRGRVVRTRKEVYYSHRDVVNLGNARDGPVARQPKRVIIERVTVVAITATIGIANPTKPDHRCFSFYPVLSSRLGACEKRKKRKKGSRERRRDLSLRFLLVRCIARVLCTFLRLTSGEGFTIF